MLILGIESTCDETAAAVVKDGKLILSNVIASQGDLHEKFGGVVPELACRRHIDVMLPVIQKALYDASVTLKDIDLIAVSYAPGLIGAIMIGLTAGKALSLASGIPFLGIHHVEAHLYAALMGQDKIDFPCIGVVLSGGHTSILLMEGIGTYRLIGETQDDAVGEAFDKVAKMMGLPYPGGPLIEELAKNGDPHAFTFRTGKFKDKPYDFSFSGLKTSVLYTLKGQDRSGQIENLTPQEKENVAASFQRVVFEDIFAKVASASEKYGAPNIVFGGGVTNNMALRKFMSNKMPGCRLIFPERALTLDNAAMIAGLAYHKWQEKKQGDPYFLEPESRVSFFRPLA